MLFALLRIRQWYKNLVIFLPLIFVGLAFDLSSVLLTSLGFLSLCLMSSVNYILNDIIDRQHDKAHPEKKDRPLASGKVSLPVATVIAMFLAAGSLVLGFLLSPTFFILLFLFFVLTQIYSLFAKNELFLDILFISVNFVLRAISGAILLNVRVSPWLILCTFFLSLFLSAGKRKADTNFLKEKSTKHKPVLKVYTEEISTMLMTVSTVLLILSYCLYSFLSIHPQLIYTIPFALYVVFRYFYLVYSGSSIARHPEFFYKDKALLLGTLVWLFFAMVLIYRNSVLFL